MAYQVNITKTAAEGLKAMPAKIRVKMAAKIQGLATEPRPHGSTKLEGMEAYRIRQGSYRAVYTITEDGEIKVVTVTDVRHRKDVYR